MVSFISFFFLLGLFYTRFIPIAIFWGLYYPLHKYTQKKYLLNQLLAAILIIFSYFIGILIMLSLPIALLNYFLLAGNNTVLVPILLSVSVDPLRLIGKNFPDKSLFKFLLTGWLTGRKKVAVLPTVFTVFEIVALVFMILGGIEVFNDYNSHSNPDILDFLFPESGGVMFWGSIAFLTLTHFYLYFLKPSPSLIKKREYLSASSKISPLLKDFVISPSLYHPYFFLSPEGRALAKQNNPSSDQLSLLLQKALIENRNVIPNEWLKK